MEPVREGEKHPLENPDILSVIFKKLPLSDLKSCRQVCKLWAVESSREMRHSAKVRIRDGKAGKNLTGFLNLIGHTQSHWLEAPPTKWFCLNNIQTAYQRFWSLCGAHIRQLSLSVVAFHSGNLFLEGILKSCPNLENLHLHKIKITSKAMATKRVEGIPPRLLSNTSVKTLACDEATAGKLKAVGVRILEHFPSLHTLRVHSGYKVIGGGGELLRSLADIREDNPSILNLRHVDISFQDIENPRSLLPALVDTGLQLEAISIRFHRQWESGILNIEQGEVTRKVIEAHAASLQQLLVTETFPWEGTIQLPENVGFPRLQKLHLDSMRRMRILRLLPNLEELSVARTELEDLALLGDMDIKPNVTKLKLVSPQNMDLRLFARCFPNVEELKLTCATSNQFPLVCELWPNLRSLWWNTGRLTISQPKTCLNDAAITGHDDQDVQIINHQMSAWTPTTVRKANITSLTNLESFVWNQVGSPLNYCAAFEGVLKLPKLKNLVVWNPKNRGNWVPLELWRDSLQRFKNITPPPYFGDLTNRSG